MCGIAGIVLKPNSACDCRGLVQRMCDGLAHRGPDDAGIFVSPDGRVALGNRRLAIRDVSPLGHMPMVSQNARVAITYNGELYNAEELRPELARAGYAFRSTSDTEVILCGYQAWGEAVFARLRGIFAVAIYDAEGRVVLARDHLGVKPLYYARTSEGLVFASELEVIRGTGLISREVDTAALVGYLELGAVPSPRTIYRDVCALEPATVRTLELDSWGERTVRFWSLPTRQRMAPQDVVAETRAALVDAVRSQLVSDVPLGAFLSGGMDSSAIVALMRQATNGTLRTCSMVFEEAEYSEAPFARAVAEQTGTEHYERVVSAQDVKRELPRILRAMDQPTLDGVNSYFVSQTARQTGLTVALSGLGGDELFGGYPTFYAAPGLERKLRLIRRVPAAATLTRSAVQLLPFGTRYGKIGVALSGREPRASAYLAYRGLFSPAEVQRLLKPEVWQSGAAFDPVGYIAGRAHGEALPLPDNPHDYAWTSRAELNTYTLNQLLRDTDVMSMAHSLEVRVPLLDHRLVEQILTLPDVAKQNGVPKALLLKAVGEYLPAAVRERSRKQGFTFPFARWLRGDLKDALPAKPGSLLNARAVQQVLTGFTYGRVHWARAWSLMVLNAWLEQNESTPHAQARTA